MFCKVRENQNNRRYGSANKMLEETAIEGKPMHYLSAIQRLTKTINQNKSNAVLKA